MQTHVVAGRVFSVSRLDVCTSPTPISTLLLTTGSLLLPGLSADTGDGWVM